MQKIYSCFSLTLLFVLLACTSGRAQTTIAIMDFDGTGPEIAISSSFPFFNDGSSGFVGIHDSNGDPMDGSPDDTGVANRASNITFAPILGDFLFFNDVEGEDAGDPALVDVVFGPVTVSGETNLLFSFDYEVFEFDGGDDLIYELTVDGTPQGEVILLDGASNLSGEGSVDVAIPDGSATASLRITVDQNGTGDYAAVDNVVVTADNTGTPCGITSFGPDASETCTSFNNDPGTLDGYFLSINYGGQDADAALAVTVDGTPTTFDISTGDDPTTDSDGTLIITSAAFLEGTGYEVVLTDAGGNCNFSVTGSVATDACVAVCDLSVAFPDDVTISCSDFTTNDNVDGITVEIDYTGVEPGVTVTAPGLTISGDDPAVDPDGTITVSGLMEGGDYLITVNGGDCTGGDALNFPISVPGNFCTPTALVVNEVLADPGSLASNDANNDGMTSGSSDEFIELFNTGETPLDLSNFTISEGAGVRYTFAPGFTLPGRAAFVLFGGGSPNVPCLSDVASTTFIGLNNGGDVVVVRNALGFPVAQMSYGNEGGDDQSVALATDGDVASGYVQHTTIPNPTGPPLTQSACLENDDPQFTLPVELITFTAAATEKSVVLDWATEHELANERFVVERSANGRQWRQLGTVRAAGSSAASYRFVDEQPLNGNNLYRLRQIDLDGAFTLYGPVTALFTTDQLIAYPNPVNDALWLNQALTPDARVNIVDNNGRSVVVRPNGNGQLDVSGLRPGFYLLRLAQGGHSSTIRFIKQ